MTSKITRRGRHTAFVALLILLLFCSPLLSSVSASAEASIPPSDQNDSLKVDHIEEKAQDPQVDPKSTQQNEAVQTASAQPSLDSLVDITPHPDDNDAEKSDSTAPSGLPVSVEEHASLDKPSSETDDVSKPSEARTSLTLPIP